MKLTINSDQMKKILKEYAASKGFLVSDKTYVTEDEEGVFSVNELEDEPSGQVEDFAYTGS